MVRESVDGKRTSRTCQVDVFNISLYEVSIQKVKMFLNLGKLFSRLPRQRCYSLKANVPKPKKSGRTQFDKSMLRPALVVIIFGSVLNHVSNQQKKFAELERRFDLKIDILNDLIERAKRGDTNFDVDEELNLVNKLFSRNSSSQNASLEVETKKLRSLYDTQTYSKKQVLDSLNRSTGALEETSLEDLLKNILDDVDSIPARAAQDSSVTNEPQGGSNSRSVNSDDIVLDERVLGEEATREKEYRDYEPSTEVHLIVENPGEMSDAAKDTKVTKFL